MLTFRGMGGAVSTLGALQAAILLLHSPQTLLADEMQTAQEVGVAQLLSAQHTEEGGDSGSALLSLPVRLGAPLRSRQVRRTTTSCHCTYAQRRHTGSELPCSVALSTWSLKAAQLACGVQSLLCGVLCRMEWMHNLLTSHHTTRRLHK